MTPTTPFIACIRLAVALLLVLYGSGAAGSDFGACQTGSLEELKKTVLEHNEQVYRMNAKLPDVWYFHGTLPAEVRSRVTLGEVFEYLEELEPRRAAVLFHAADNSRLCTWLITSDRQVVSHVANISQQELEKLQPSRWQELAILTARTARVAAPRPPQVPLSREEASRHWRNLLNDIRDIVLPLPIARQLIKDNTDTLIVVPITLRAADIEPEQRAELSSPMRLVFSLSTVPFLALPLGNEQIVDRMSVVVAPGFLSFANAPRPARRKYCNALVAGSPVRAGLQSLPGAREEVEQVAAFLETTPYVREQARKDIVRRELTSRERSLDFILLATHGRASARHPVDGSYLEFSDEPLSAREIALRFTRPRPGQATEVKSGWLSNRPVVVMSACETGLGKDFEGGTIGLARAWHWAGASNVVMSLWGVDDQAARDLMINFVHKLDKGMPVDMALRKAAYDARRLEDNPAQWAAFSVFGMPEKISAK